MRMTYSTVVRAQRIGYKQDRMGGSGGGERNEGGFWLILYTYRNKLAGVFVFASLPIR